MRDNAGRPCVDVVAGTALCLSLRPDRRPAPGGLLRQRRGRRPRRPRRTFLDAWAGGHTAAAAKATTDADAPRPRCWSRPRRTSRTRAVARSSARSTSRTAHGHRRLDRDLGPRGRPRLELRRHAATCARATTSWQVVAEPTVVHPELGEGQHLVLARSLPDRAPITDADRRPAVHARPRWSTSASTRRRSPTCRRWPRRSRPATGVAAEEIAADVAGGQARASSSRSSPCGVPTSRRSARRCSTCPARSSRPRTRLLAPIVPLRRRPARPGRRGHRRGHRGDARTTASPRYAAGDQLGLSGLQRAFQEQLTGTAGFTVSVGEHRREHRRRRGRQIDVGRTRCRARPCRRRSSRPCRTPPTPPWPAQTLPTHLVVVRPGTGEILAVVSNEAADAGNALAGQLPARLEHEDDDGDGAAVRRHAHPGHPGALPGHDGRRRPRVRERGQVRPRHRAAHARRSRSPATRPSSSRRSSCPTARSPTAAASYGVGTDWKLPVGIFSGSVPADSTGTTKAADAIGQGEVLMSPAQLALVAAGIASGKPGRAGGGRRRRARRAGADGPAASRCSTRSGR